jgi:predicted enzyme related to lactoylglutathione lyase
MGYIQTADCDAQTAKAASLGAKILVAPTAIEGSGKFSVLSDPQGAVFALFSSK